MNRQPSDGANEPEPETGDRSSPLEVTVIFTNEPRTLWALERACDLARGLNARIRLVVPQVVPYPAPMNSPPVRTEFNENRFRTMASQQSIDTRVDLYLCRDRDEVLKQVLKPASAIVIGARKSWWPSAEKALARRLRRRGHRVILACTEGKTNA